MRKLVSTKMRKNGILLKQFREDKINRNILYCKFIPLPFYTFIRYLLIETFCIVNLFQKVRISPIFYINRNILYCKFILGKIIKSSKSY